MGRQPKYAPDLVRSAIIEYEATNQTSAEVADKYGIPPKYFDRLRQKARAMERDDGPDEELRHTGSGTPQPDGAPVPKMQEDLPPRQSPAQRVVSDRMLEKLVAIVSLQREGLNQVEIGHRLGVTGQAISHLLKVYMAEVAQIRIRLDKLVPRSTDANAG